MTNKEIAGKFNRLANLMELHKENPFKIRSYQNAYIVLRKLGSPLTEMDEEAISSMKGIGKAISAKIGELIQTGQMSKLKEFEEITPSGVQDMLEIKGLGPKKIRQLWKELEIESVGELLYACNENRLITLKGFGEKTQQEVLQKVKYFQQTRDQFLYASVESEAEAVIIALKQHYPETPISFTGSYRRKMPVLDKVEILIGADPASIQLEKEATKLGLIAVESSGTWKTKSGYPMAILYCQAAEFGSALFQSTGPEEFVKRTDLHAASFPEESEIFVKMGSPDVLPELRDLPPAELDSTLLDAQADLVKESDIKGVVHAHSTYSDGLHSLREMAEESRSKGFEYLVMTDHSQSAFYANGLKADRVLAQMEEIDQLNAELAPFRIFKGIESDILYDGSLDYEDAILKKFDCIIASVHSQLKMDREKATQRLIAAIQNPYTRILGHPTGRLLLSREGYPIDHKAVIKACAAHNVAIELNANPLRLDIDWKWINYAISCGVPVSINPDAHSKEGIYHIKYGVLAARKGGLLAKDCLNTMNLNSFEAFLQQKG